MRHNEVMNRGKNIKSSDFRSDRNWSISKWKQLANISPSHIIKTHVKKLQKYF